MRSRVIFLLVAVVTLFSPRRLIKQAKIYRSTMETILNTALRGNEDLLGGNNNYMVTHDKTHVLLGAVTVSRILTPKRNNNSLPGVLVTLYASGKWLELGKQERHLVITRVDLAVRITRNGQPKTTYLSIDPSLDNLREKLAGIMSEILAKTPTKA